MFSRPVETLTPLQSDVSRRADQRARHWRRIVAAVGTVAVAGTAYVSADAATPNGQPYTPNQCIQLNHGDYNACNVGNSGRGDLPYQRVTYTPNDCIRLNHGDYNACNVGNSGRGDLPYQPIGTDGGP